MKLSRILAFFCSLFLSTSAFCQRQIDIRSQSDFDNMESYIKQALKNGDTDLNVRIHPGIFFFSSYHLNLSNLNNPDARVSIKGDRATIISSADGSKRKEMPLEYNVTYLNGDLSIADGWSPSFQLQNQVEIVDPTEKLCRIKLPDGHSPEKQPLYLNLTKWYLNAIYKVTRVKDDYIYFVADDLKDGYNKLLTKYDINNDYGYGGMYPRCQLYYGTPANYKYRCVNSQFLTMGYSKLKSLSISGLDFVGNAGNSSLLVANDCKMESLMIQDCSFRNIQGVVFYVIKTDNVTFDNNKVDNCNEAVLISENKSRNTQVTNNTMVNIGLRMNNVKVVQCVSEDFKVSGNTFCNFSYAAIGAGVGQNNSSSICTGTIEKNEIYMDSAYSSNAALHTLMDSGAIYIGTVTDGITIRNNYIHDIAGAKDNRGIFCDDGTKNVTITENVVERIQNSYCIDLRNVLSVAEKVPDHNTSNVCENNVVDGNIRFYIRDNSCRESNNKMIGERGYKTMKAYKTWRKNQKE